MAKYILSAFADEAAAALDDQIAALLAQDIHLIELRGVDGVSCADLTDAQADAVRRKLDAAGIRLSALGSPYGKAPIDRPFEPHLARFRRGLELCGRLDCRRMRMFSFYIPSGDAPERWRDEVLARLEVMLDAAEAAGVLLAHENEKGIYGDTDARCADLLEHFGDRLGCVFDPANFIQCGVDPVRAFDRLGERITYMHIKDARMADGSVVRAGRGDGHVAELLRRLSAMRRDEVTLTVEPHLTVFEGLGGLQGEALLRGEAFPDSRSAFDAACAALRQILTDQEDEADA